MQAPLNHTQRSGSETIDTTYTLELYEGLAEEAVEKLRKGMLASLRAYPHELHTSNP